MAKLDLVMPKMGESIMEATILKWVKNVGDKVSEDETILEIATDKVDSEIPSPVDGVIAEVLFNEDDVVEVGKVIARIETEATVESEAPTAAPAPVEETESNGNGHAEAVIEPVSTAKLIEEVPFVPETKETVAAANYKSTNRFYSPLVKNIASKENIGLAELETVQGTGKDGRVTKTDILSYLANRSGQTTVVTESPVVTQKTQAPEPAAASVSSKPAPTTTTNANGNVEIIEMDRMRKLIADHMVNSKRTSPHVTSFVEADVTNIVNWRNRIKNDFQTKHGQKITFTPIFIDAVVKAIKDFPLINISVEGNTIIKKNDINVGMATALPSGNLIVPVIKNADHLSLIGLTNAVNGLAGKARNNKLSPDDIQGGTFTITNVGTFGNVMGTPIINQPQVAIMATGAIRKKPAVVETEFGDVIAIRQMMYLSLSYDHRVVDGFLGGSFLRRVADYLEAFDESLSI